MANHNAPGHLLVVDDNKVLRLLLGRNLEQQGHTVSFAENGRQALEKLRAERFDLMCLDIEMPDMDGYEVLAELSADPQLRDFPVIVTSALEELDSVVKCIEMGAEDYLTKPVNPVLLRARIGASLEKKRLRDEQRELIRRFATPEVAEDLQKSGFALGGKFVEASAMFSDIRSFTAFVETNAPADVIELLNNYYALMFEAIESNGGVVNQMIGDGLMAIFGAPTLMPNHAEQAVKAALEMVEMVELFNMQQAIQGKHEIRIGVGIASGQMIAGYTGTQHRATYTCVGDTVNLAARLEAHTKVAGKSILIDAMTEAALTPRISRQSLGSFQAKGKVETVEIFTVGEA
ncbi:MAG: response regulator [Caldilineales bacterium]|nr:response regulator [Caldilineales bacterium]